MPKQSEQTRLAQAGVKPEEHHGALNVPPYRMSTVAFPNLATFEAACEGYLRYGSIGTPTTRALEQAYAELEGAHDTVSFSTGLAPITTALTAFTSNGDHILAPENVYGPTRRFCGKVLKKYGVETTFYDPLIGAGIEKLIQPNTKVVFIEAPGSITMEVPDVPAIVAAAKKHNALTMLDNTWATPLFFKPLELGIDIALQAGTKYIAGHSDVMLGLAACNEKTFKTVKEMAINLGHCPGSEETYLGLRGLKTLHVRLQQHQKSALEIAQWLKTRPEVEKVLHPALPDCPGHENWKRDFKGSSGVFSILPKTKDKTSIARFVDSLKLFKIGFSWGGFESLVFASPHKDGWIIRLQIGLENAADLIADLEENLKFLGA